MKSLCALFFKEEKLTICINHFKHLSGKLQRPESCFCAAWSREGELGHREDPRIPSFRVSTWEHCLSRQLPNSLPLATVSQLHRVSCGGRGMTEASSSQNDAAGSRDSGVINRKWDRTTRKATQIFTFLFTDTPKWKENHQGTHYLPVRWLLSLSVGKHSLAENSWEKAIPLTLMLGCAWSSDPLLGIVWLESNSWYCPQGAGHSWEARTQTQD